MPGAQETTTSEPDKVQVAFMQPETGGEMARHQINIIMTCMASLCDCCSHPEEEIRAVGDGVIGHKIRTAP